MLNLYHNVLSAVEDRLPELHRLVAKPSGRDFRILTQDLLFVWSFTHATTSLRIALGAEPPFLTCGSTPDYRAAEADCVFSPLSLKVLIGHSSPALEDSFTREFGEGVPKLLVPLDRETVVTLAGYLNQAVALVRQLP